MTYQKHKAEFLDLLQPDDFRNPSSFNQAEEIIDELFLVAEKKENPQEFIAKAASNLFRDRSNKVENLIKLLPPKGVRPLPSPNQSN